MTLCEFVNNHKDLRKSDPGVLLLQELAAHVSEQEITPFVSLVRVHPWLLSLLFFHVFTLFCLKLCISLVHVCPILVAQFAGNFMFPVFIQLLNLPETLYTSASL